MLLNDLLHLLSAQHVSGTYMSIIRSSILHLCYDRTWCVMPWLLVVGGQVQGSSLDVRDEESCSSSFPHPGRIAGCTLWFSHNPIYLCSKLRVKDILARTCETSGNNAASCIASNLNS